MPLVLRLTDKTLIFYRKDVHTGRYVPTHTILKKYISDLKRGMVQIEKMCELNVKSELTIIVPSDERA